MLFARVSRPLAAVGFFTLATVVAGCGKTIREKVILEREANIAPQTSQDVSPGATPVQGNQPAVPQNVTPPEVHVQGDLSLSKEQYLALLQEPLLFGADLQYADIKDEELGFAAQTALSGGKHKVARFQRVGTKLLLNSDESIFVESDFPAQENLLEFEVVSENDSTVQLRASSVALGSSKVFEIKPDSARAPWIRSIEFDPNGNYLLIESSVRDVDGGVYHFLESAFPRKNLGGADKALMLDPERADAEPEGYGKLFKAIERLGVFTQASWSFGADSSKSWDNKVTKKEKNAVLRYDISNKKTIDWWVTDNLSPELENDVKAGVEGWNRYFKDFSKDTAVVVFKGRLPKNVKLGDPRYNIVLFDKVQDAGAAYESQSYDPETGLQSHSMIYMPFSWYNLGSKMFLEGIDKANDAEAQKLLDVAMRYVTNSAQKEDASLAARMRKSKFFNAKRVHCLRDINFNEGISAIVSETGKTAEDAGRALFRSTLLHEVGHALGMEHNFRGSNVGKPNSKKTADWEYSSSVMDYNTPQLEDGELFKSLNKDGSAADPTVGAILAYDRQFIDIVYNNAQQVLANPAAFPVLPYCNDADADNKELGVSSTCLRYDFFSDATAGINVVRNRILSDKPNLDASEGGYATLQGFFDARKNAVIAKIAAAKSSKELISDSDKPGILDAALLEEIPEIVAYFTGGAGTPSKSYIGYRALTARYLELLGEWKPLPNFKAELESADMKESETFTALKEGWSSMPIFDEKGAASSELYAKHQAETRAQVLRSALEALETRTESQADGSRVLCRFTKAADGAVARVCSTDALAGLVKADAVLVVAAARARLAIADIEAAAVKSGLLDEEATEVLKDLVSTSQLLSETQAKGAGSKGQAFIGANLPVGGVTLPGEDTSIGRGALSTNIAKVFFDSALNLATDSNPANAVSSRSAAASIMAKLFKRSEGWDTGVVRAQWNANLVAAETSSKADFLKLDAKLKSSNYLSERERTNHELLARMSKLIDETLKLKAK